MADFDKLKEEIPSETEGFQNWGKKDVSYKDIVLRQIELCRLEGSKQMINGGKFYTKTQDGFMQIELFNQKMVYTQCVLSFQDLMLRYFDEQIKEEITQIQKEIESKLKQIVSYYISTEPNSHHKKLAEQFGIISNTAIGNQLLSSFDNFKYNQHRKLFQKLLLLFDRKNEITGKRTAGVYK